MRFMHNKTRKFYTNLFNFSLLYHTRDFTQIFKSKIIDIITSTPLIYIIPNFFIGQNSKTTTQYNK